MKKKGVISLLIVAVFLWMTKGLYVKNVIEMTLQVEGSGSAVMAVDYRFEKKGREIKDTASKILDLEKGKNFNFLFYEEALRHFDLRFVTKGNQIRLKNIVLSGDRVVHIDYFSDGYKTFYAQKGDRDFRSVREKDSSTERTVYVPVKQDVDLKSKRVFFPSAFITLAVLCAVVTAGVVRFKSGAIFFLTTMSYAAFSYTCDVNFSLTSALFAGFIAFSLLYFYGRVLKNAMLDTPLFVLSAAFGILSVLALSSEWDGSFDFIVRYPLRSGVIAIGYGALMYVIGTAFFNLLDGRALFKEYEIKNKAWAFYERHVVLCSLVVFALLWLPFMITYYPGTFPADPKIQLRMFEGVFHRTQHHPAFSTLLLGWLHRLGVYLGNDDFGLFLYVLFQIVICALVFAAGLKALNKEKVSAGYQMFALFFFAVSPCGGMTLIWGVKDILYSGVFVFFILKTCLITRRGEFSSPKDFLSYFFVALVVCLLRHNGFYIVLPVLIFICAAYVKREEKRRAALMTVGLIAVLFVLNNIVFVAAGYKLPSKKEYFSVPFQQTARYVKYHGDEVTADEKKAIDAVLKYDLLAENYNPRVSDNVKKQYRISGRSDEFRTLASYFKVWAKMFFKHPVTYAEAFVANTSGYYAFIPYGVPLPAEPKRNDVSGVYIGYPSATYYYRTVLWKIFVEFWQIPFLYVFENCAFYSWLSFLLMLWTGRRKGAKRVVLLLPAVLNFIVCLASPVNMMFRYCLPIVFSMPVVLPFCAGDGEDEIKKS